MSTIDLDIGEPDEESPSQRRRRIKRSDSSESKPKSKPTDRDNNSLVGRLDSSLDKIADQMEAKGDEELAVAIKEERHAMSQGLVSLTASVTPLRPLLVLILALVEPLLAFWRVGRILFYRFLNWRANRPVPEPTESEPASRFEPGVL